MSPSADTPPFRAFSKGLRTDARELDVADLLGFSEPVPAARGTYEAWWFVFLGSVVG
jgi:hypothetical protein